MTRCGSVAAVRRWSVAVIGCLVAFVISALVVSPAHASKLSQEKARAKSIAQSVAELDQRLAGIVDAYAAASTKLAAVNQQIADNEQRLANAKQQLKKAEWAVSQRAVAMYKERDVTLVDVLAGSSSFGEMLTQVQFLAKVNQSDEQMMVSLAKTKKRVAERRRDLLADRAAARSALAAQRAEKARINEALAERRDTLKGLRGEIDQLEASLKEPVVKSTPTLEPTAAASPSSSDTPSGGWWPLIQQAASANGINAKSMYRLMMIESGGVPDIVGSGMFYGLFQYYPSTWKGSWNPWRSCDICDGAAQIKATALAIKMGKGPYWWTTSYRWAFGVD